MHLQAKLLAKQTKTVGSSEFKLSDESALSLCHQHSISIPKIINNLNHFPASLSILVSFSSSFSIIIFCIICNVGVNLGCCCFSLLPIADYSFFMFWVSKSLILSLKLNWCYLIAFSPYPI